jgi:DNA-binding response OmpR family regulator
MAESHILIVDDEPKVGFFLKKSLELSQKRCRVSTARSGKGALKIIGNSKVDLLITDLRMPGLSGLELIQRVKKSSPETQTILITAYGNDEVRAEARRLEVYRYVAKPFNVRDFTGVVDQALKEIALTRPEFTIFSDKSFERMTARLEELRADVDAQCAYLADMQGQCLVEVGPTESVDSTMLLTLLAGGFATSAELARQFNGGKATNLSYQEGEHYDIYSANVGESLIITMLFDRSVQKSRVGMVWLYTRRAIDDLQTLLSTLDSESPAWEFEDDFESTIMAELDTAFSDDFSVTETDSAAIEPPEATQRQMDHASFGEQAGTPLSSVNEESEKSGSGSPQREPGSGDNGQDDSLLSFEEAMEKGLLPSDFQDR